MVRAVAETVLTLALPLAPGDRSMATSLQRGGSNALAGAKSVVAVVLLVLRRCRNVSGHPRRGAEGHNEIKIVSPTRPDDSLRTRCGVRRVRNDGESPERPDEFNGGRQLFYLRGNVLVRVKTRGTRFRPRADVTVSMCDIRGAGDNEWHAWDRERAKFTVDGHWNRRTSPTVDHRIRIRSRPVSSMV